MAIDKKTAEYLQGLLKLPHVGSRGVDALYQEVKKQGKAYNTKLKSVIGCMELLAGPGILRTHLGRYGAGPDHCPRRSAALASYPPCLVPPSTPDRRQGHAR